MHDKNMIPHFHNSMKNIQNFTAEYKTLKIEKPIYVFCFQNKCRKQTFPRKLNEKTWNGLNMCLPSLQAANPGCVLEDFVRWYSPRDWIEEKMENSVGDVVAKG